MRIKSIETNPAIFTNQEFVADKPICIICGQKSDIVLDLLRELIGDFDMQSSLDNCNNGHFALYGSVEMNDKNYDVCYISNADNSGEKRLAVNFIPNTTKFSMADTKEYEEKCRVNNMGKFNLYNMNSVQISNDYILSESDRNIHSFNEYLKDARSKTQKGDARPLFIYNFFDHIDEAENVTPFIDELALLGRQVFISVGANYPEEKMSHPFVHIINLDGAPVQGWEWLDIGEVYDRDYTVINCPVCGHKTFDNFWICSCCGWEYDGFDENHHSAANGVTLQEYRKQYQAMIKERERQNNV